MSSFQTALAWVQALKPVRALLTRARQPKGAKGASERVDPDRALGRAVKAGNRERVRDLLRSRKVKARSALLLLAVKQRDAEMAHELLCHGVKVTDAVLDAADQAARASWSLDAARAAAWARDAGREPRGHPPHLRSTHVLRVLLKHARGERALCLAEAQGWEDIATRLQHELQYEQARRRP